MDRMDLITTLLRMICYIKLVFLVYFVINEEIKFIIIDLICQENLDLSHGKICQQN